MCALEAALSAGSLPEVWQKKQAELKRDFTDLAARAGQSFHVTFSDGLANLSADKQRASIV